MSPCRRGQRNWLSTESVARQACRSCWRSHATASVGSPGRPDSQLGGDGGGADGSEPQINVRSARRKPRGVHSIASASPGPASQKTHPLAGDACKLPEPRVQLACTSETTSPECWQRQQARDRSCFSGLGLAMEAYWRTPGSRDAPPSPITSAGPHTRDGGANRWRCRVLSRQRTSRALRLISECLRHFCESAKKPTQNSQSTQKTLTASNQCNPKDSTAQQNIIVHDSHQRWRSQETRRPEQAERERRKNLRRPPGALSKKYDPAASPDLQLNRWSQRFDVSRTSQKRNKSETDLPRTV